MRILIVLLLLIPLNKLSQSNKNIISFNILGSSSIVGVTYERFVYKKISIELGVGIIGLGCGINYYFKKRKEGINTYIGIKQSSLFLVDMGGGLIYYMPIGISFLNQLNFNISFDFGPGYYKWIKSDFMQFQNEQIKKIIPYGNIKIGVLL